VKAILENVPELASIHPWDPVGADEEIMLAEYTFLSTMALSAAHVPELARWIALQDQRPVYRYVERLLKFLQWQKRQAGKQGERWVLKAPYHLAYIDVLFEVFPDAVVVQTHRDPLETIPSISSMTYALWRLAADHPDPVAIGREWGAWFRRALQRCLELRDARYADRFVDVWYQDALRDPIAEVRRIYAFVGRELGDDAEARMRRWLRENAREKRAPHEYAMATFGFTREQLERDFAAYRERFVLPRAAAAAAAPGMPNEIRIDDLAAPRLTDVQRELLAWGETVEVDFSEAAILDAARRRTGLDDFGPDDFRARLRVLREEWGAEPELTRFQRAVLHPYLVRYCANRLLIQDTWKRHPEIFREEIAEPVIVVGMPRSGTTHLVNLLAADARFHSLPLWESYEPVPLPGEASLPDGTDPRYQRCAEAWEAMQRSTPFIAAMHPMNPDHIHEELELMGPDFASYGFEWLEHSPKWRDHYLSTDQTPHYEYMKNVLRLIQCRRGPPRRRWVLKCPQHLEQLPVLRKVFPDATVVFTHRDPVAVIQSTITMQAYSQRMRRKRVALGALLEYWTDRIEHLLRACVRDRGLFPPERSVDSPFHVFMADPMAMLERVYAAAGLDLEPARAKLERYLAEHPRGKEGRIVYDLRGDFGVDPAALRARFQFYLDRFPVRPEVR
jgi:hypothetical protein